MLRATVERCLRFRGVVIAIACVVVVYGVAVARRAPLDVFPDFVPPQVSVQTEAPGLAAEQVEALVTTAVEGAISGLGHLSALRSESIQGLSVVTVVFEEGTDLYQDRQLLAERLAGVAAQLPVGTRPPTMSALTSSTMDLLKIGLVSDALPPLELRSFASWTLRPRLLAVPGVAQVNVFGGAVRELQIQVQPDRLLAHGLALGDVLAAARASTGIVGAGFIDTENQRVVLETEGQAIDPGVLGQVAVAQRGAMTVRLSDLAHVVEAGAPRFGDALVQGRPGVLLTMLGQYGSNTREVTLAVERALEEMRPVLEHEGITLYPRLHRPATFIEIALENLRASLLLGAVLVAAVLFAFLGHTRTALISLTAIPLSLLAAVIALTRMGFTLNTMTLGGLAIAVGEVVDDAIVDVENIVRRLRENQRLGLPRSSFAVVLDASLEVRSAVVFASLVVVTVFLPVLTLTGLQGSFFAPLALAYILAILASLAVALTVTPALALVVLGGGGFRDADEPWLQQRIRRAYQGTLARVAEQPRRVVTAAALACSAALLALPFFGREFLPDFREGHYVLQVSALPGTSLDEMRRIGTSISAELLRVKGVATVEQQIGRAERGEDTWGPHRSEFHVELETLDAREQVRVGEEIRAVLAGYPGLQSELLTFLGDRISETITGEVAPVVVNIFGDDLDALDATAREVVRALAGVPGAADVVMAAPPGAPRIGIRLRPERLAALGFRPLDVMEAIQTAYQGTLVGQSYRANQSENVVVILEQASRRDPEAVGSLVLQNATGLRVPLGVLADIVPASDRYLVLHEGARRRQTVTCNPTRDVVSFVADARRAVAERVQMPPGVYAVFGGEARVQSAARSELLLHAAIAGVGVVLLLAIGLRRGRNLVLLLANLPFALVGGVLALVVAGVFDPEAARISIGTLVGFVTLFGITTRNSIMMISHFDHLVREEGMEWGPETALRGATERVIPILMTASVTALGLLPLALGSGQAGREIEGPMAIVILGGLLSSTALNLLVLPTLALRYGRFERPVA